MVNVFYMENSNFWQLFLGKEPYSKKSDFVKAWLLWWAITILVLFILSLTTTLNLRSIGIGLSFGFYCGCDTPASLNVRLFSVHWPDADVPAGCDVLW